MYLFADNLSPNDTYSIDLSNLQAMESMGISLPQGVDREYHYLYGYPDGQNRDQGRILLDHTRRDVSSGTYTTFFPPLEFSDYRYSNTLFDYSNMCYWLSTYYGDIPKTMTTINASYDFNQVTQDRRDFSIMSQIRI